MKIKLTVFKSTGKFYEETVVEMDGDPGLHSKEFVDFVNRSLPARPQDGMVITQNDDPASYRFYTHLFRITDTGLA